MIKKWKSSFKARLMTLSILPVAFTAISLVIVVATKVGYTMSDQMMEQLRDTSYALRATIGTMPDEELTVSKDGTVLYAGDRDLTYLNDVLAEFTERTGVYTSVIYGDTTVISSIAREQVVGTKVSSEIVRTVLKGEEYISMEMEVGDKNCVATYIPLYGKDGSKVVGMIFAGISKENQLGAIQSVIKLAFAVAVLLAMIAIAISVAALNKMNKVILGAADVCKDLTNGDFTKNEVAAGINRADELGMMVRNVNELKSRFAKTISGVKENIHTLVDSSASLKEVSSSANRSMNDLSGTAEGISKGASTQAEEVTSSAMSVGNIISHIEQIGDSVEVTNECTHNMAKESKKVVSEFDSMIVDTKESCDKLTEISDKMKYVVDAVGNVVHAAEKINDIAEQTNLLALNASIEAARAGEAGSGFAVVATEISNLAKGSNESAEEIRQIMSTLCDETDEAAKLVTDMSEVMERQMETSENSKASLKSLTEFITLTDENVANVKNGATEVTALCNELNGSINNLSAISEENAASAQKTTASIEQVTSVIGEVSEKSEDLKSVADTLNELTEFFKLD